MTQTNPAGTSHAGVDASDLTSHSHSRKDLSMLIMGALGVVYGDIGTSPIYAFRQAMHIRPGAASSDSEILGLLSLIVWALTLTVSLKYVFFVTRADNNGEGGTLSLMALARKTFTNPPVWITVLGVLVGASLVLSYLGAYAFTNAMLSAELIKPWAEGHDPRPKYLLFGFAGLMTSFILIAGVFRVLSRRQFASIDETANAEEEFRITDV